MLAWLWGLVSTVLFCGMVGLLLVCGLGGWRARSAVIALTLLLCGLGAVHAQPVVKGAAVAASGDSCVCELNAAGLCRTGPGRVDLQPREYVYSYQCGAPVGSRIIRMTYLGDLLGTVRSIVIEWQPPRQPGEYHEQ
jgi:hypothetical protein